MNVLAQAKEEERKRNEPTNDISTEHLEMMQNDTDPLAAMLAASSQTAAADPLDPLSGGSSSMASDPLAGLAGGMGAVDVSDPLGLGQMERSSTSTAATPAAPPPPPPAAGGGGCTALALKLGLPPEIASALAACDPDEMRVLLATADGKATVDAKLKSLGLKSMGHRLKLVAGLLSDESYYYGAAATFQQCTSGHKPSSRG